MFNDWTRRTLFVAAVVALTTVPLVRAATPVSPSDNSQQLSQRDFTASSDVAHARLGRVSRLIGMEVRDAAGKKIGRIEDAIIEARTGRIEYVAIRYDLTLGIFVGKLAAAPLEALSRTADGKAMHLTREGIHLKDAPQITTAVWPTAKKQPWYDQLYAFYGVNKPQEPLAPAVGHSREQALAESEQTYQLSQMRGLKVTTWDRDDAGRVSDILLDTNSHRAMFVVVAYNGTLFNASTKCVAPYSAFDFTRSEADVLDAAKVNADVAMLRANGVGAHPTIELAQADRARQVFSNFGRTPYWNVYGYEGDQTRRQLAPQNSSSPPQPSP